MNLLCQYKRAPLTRSRRSTIPAGNWREILTLVCGLLLLVTGGIGGYRQVNAGMVRPISPSPDSLPVRNDSQVVQPLSILAAVFQTNCDRLGWSPTSFGLKDHSVFTFNGSYYIVSIRTPDENVFAYARSTDLCTWEDLGVVIYARIPDEWDEREVWAPFVLEDNGFFYLYYTGANRDYTQSIMLATSTNPADPGSWQRQGMVFQPDHEGMLWQAGSWADCRDATVLKVEDVYYMYYTGRDAAGPIVGLATSFSPLGPWLDTGMTLTLPQTDSMAESPSVVSHEGAYYLLYNYTQHGEEYRIGYSMTGPWSDAFSLTPGWAHEIWVGSYGLNYTSYLQGYEVVIDHIQWNNFFRPARLFVGARLLRHFMPILLNP